VQRLRRLLALDDIGHHVDALVEPHHGDRVGRFVLEALRRAVVDDVAVEHATAARLESLDVLRAGERAEGARREIRLAGILAALKDELSPLASIPEMLRLGRRDWYRFLVVGQFDLPFCLRYLGCRVSAADAGAGAAGLSRLGPICARMEGAAGWRLREGGRGVDRKASCFETGVRPSSACGSPT